MLTISKPLSAGQARAYHKEEFANAQGNYYTEGDHIPGQWHGKLADQWGLHGEVQEEHFARLANGQHPITSQQLVRHQAAREYVNERGGTVITMEHRAGWDATFSAPKSVSLTALVGGDDRVRQAHRESMKLALDELEKYVQARIGRNHPAETTGKWVAASFEHDSARPVGGYAAPQLHTHVVFFNLTETSKSGTRPYNHRSCIALSSTRLRFIARNWRCTSNNWGMRSSKDGAASPRSRVTLPSISRHLVRAVAKSRNISPNTA